MWYILTETIVFFCYIIYPQSRAVNDRKKVSEKFQKTLAFPQLSLYNVKAFRTGADSPHVAQPTDGLGREADASRRNRTNM